MGEKSSDRTIQRVLKEKGFFYGKVQKIESLTKDHKKKRVAYAEENRKQDWNLVVFSDEKTFQLGAGEEYAWQMPGVHYTILYYITLYYIILYYIILYYIVLYYIMLYYIILYYIILYYII